ncbi:MAG: DUF3137 domain-containing protein [Paludibacter sp.]|jgi:hypothetical protein|nr:DUF3137 domain-containing protein [Paludibacter sp.]
MLTQIQDLQQELTAVLKKAERNRKLLKICRIICYGGSLVYFIGIFVSYVLLVTKGESPFIHNNELNPNPTNLEANKILIYIVPLFVLITVGSYGLGFFYKKFATVEQNSVRRIIKQMFPDAKCYLEGKVMSNSLVNASHLFGNDSGNSMAYSSGSIIFDNGGQKLEVNDMIVRKNLTAHTNTGGFLLVFKMLFGGLFAHTRLAKTLSGSIVILPDHLERHLDYLAKTVQSMKNINGNKLVQLEDIEFERHFAVYSTDEILARYILTPAMMLRMTELRKKYDRDIMLSFVGNNFFFAVSMPEGFLTLGDDSSAVVNDLYDNISTVREILKDLKLNKAPEQTIVLNLNSARNQVVL